MKTKDLFGIVMILFSMQMIVAVLVYLLLKFA